MRVATHDVATDKRKARLEKPGNATRGAMKKMRRSPLFPGTPQGHAPLHMGTNTVLLELGFGTARLALRRTSRDVAPQLSPTDQQAHRMCAFDSVLYPYSID